MHIFHLEYVLIYGSHKPSALTASCDYQLPCWTMYACTITSVSLSGTDQYEVVCKTEDHGTSYYSSPTVLKSSTILFWRLHSSVWYPWLSILFWDFTLIKSLKFSFSAYIGSLSMSGEVISRDFLITWKLSLIPKISSFFPALSESIPTDISFKGAHPSSAGDIMGRTENCPYFHSHPPPEAIVILPTSVSLSIILCLDTVSRWILKHKESITKLRLSNDERFNWFSYYTF